jgi:hypothetical protein
VHSRVQIFPFLSFHCVLCSTFPTVVSCAAAKQQNKTTGPPEEKFRGISTSLCIPFVYNLCLVLTFNPRLSRASPVLTMALEPLALHWPGSVPGCRDFEALLF